MLLSLKLAFRPSTSADPRFLLRRRFFLDNFSRAFSSKYEKGFLQNNILWLKKIFSPSKSFNVLRSLHALKLTGISVATLATLLRRGYCKTTTASKRTVPQVSCSIQPSLTFGEFFSLVWPYFHWLLLAALAALAVAVLNIKIPGVLGELINLIAKFLKNDAALVGNPLAAANPVAIHLLQLYALQALFTFICITSLSLMGERMGSELRIRLFNHLLHFDMKFYDTQRTGELCDTLNYDIQEFKSSFKMCAVQGLKQIAQIVGSAVSMYLTSPQMTLVALTALPAFILIGSLFGRILRTISLRAQAQGSIAAGLADEALQNIRTVKAFAMEDAETLLYKREVEKARVINERLGAGIGLFQAATNIFLNGLVLSVLYVGGQMVSTNQITPGDLISFLTTSQTIQKSLGQLSLIFGHAVRMWTSCARITNFLKIEPSSNHGTLKIPYHSLVGSVQFRDVSFAYPSQPDSVVLDQLNLKIEAGKTIALCGPSGSGKSTIAALIERLYDPLAGSITLDGADIADLDPYWLRKNVIGVISQEPVLFATTIKENIRYGRPNATDAEVRAAAELANAAQFVEQFPAGYETVVGERGATLSGGQKQRIAIARALLKNPPILILDEATSALDAESEKRVQEALDRVMKDRTVIIVAHRLSTIQNADKIYVIQEGNVVESGTHKELIRQRGEYHKLVQTQQNALLEGVH